MKETVAGIYDLIVGSAGGKLLNWGSKVSQELDGEEIEEQRQWQTTLNHTEFDTFKNLTHPSGYNGGTALGLQNSASCVNT